MQVTVVHENESGHPVEMALEPDATPIDVLEAVKGEFSLDLAKKRYVVVPPSGVAWNKAEPATAVGIKAADQLIIAESEQGFR